MTLLAEKFTPSERYRSQIEFLRSRATPTFRHATIHSMLDLAKSAADRPALRFRVVRDAVSLLAPDVQAELAADADSTAPNADAVRDLLASVARAKDCVGVEADSIWTELESVVEETLRTTWDDFEQFKGSDFGRQTFELTQGTADLAEYDNWFARALPTLLLPCDPTQETSAQLDARIEFLLSKIAASDEADTFGLRDGYLYRAWDYVRQHEVTSNSEA